jgi:hypothetical protein
MFAYGVRPSNVTYDKPHLLDQLLMESINSQESTSDALELLAQQRRHRREIRRQRMARERLRR